jgi:two-component system, NtrC family, response regulator HydG
MSPNETATPTRFTALVVDDDAGFRESLALLVRREGFEVREACNLARARECLAEAVPDVVLVDRGLPDGDGIQLLHDDGPSGESEFIVITGEASVDSAVQALRAGALDYLTKPIDHARLKSILAGVARTRRFKVEVQGLRGELRQLGRFGRLVGRSPAMHQVYDLIARVAPTQAGVFLTGESGTGKELAAETIHLLSRRRDGPFLAVNCGAIVPTLIESELFGHEKGSFTGADNSRRGYFEEADRGTLFLDEVTEMPAELQAKLLRVLETDTLMRVGGSKVVPVDVRVIAATNRDPAKAVKDRALREDLFYRLNVFPISLPPLRTRGDDLDLLADYFLDAVNAREGTQKTWAPAARAPLRKYRWPGNVRELKNLVERAAIMADTAIGPELLPHAGVGEAERWVEEASTSGTIPVRVGASLDEVERQVILATLESFKGDKKRTAEVLGISLKTLYSRLNVAHAISRTDRSDPVL